MSQKQKLNRIVVLRFIVTLLVGITFVYAGIMEHIEVLKFKNNAVQAEGIITNINEYRKPNEDTDRHNVTVAFTADGAGYESITYDWNRDMYVGQTITVFYNQEDTSDIRLQMPSASFVRIIIVVGLCFILMAVIFFKAEISASQNLSPMAIGCMVFLIVGIFSFACGLELHISHQDFKKTAAQTEGIVIDIKKYPNPSDSYDVDVIVAFTVNGVEYQGPIDESGSHMYVGRPLTVFYNPDNPRGFRTYNPLFSTVLILVGLLFLLIASTPLIMSLLKHITLRRFTGDNLSYTNENSTYTKKDKVLKDAPFVLNKRDQPWEVIVKGDTIEARWKYKAVSSSMSRTRIKEHLFVFAVTLNDAGKWWEDLDIIGTTPNSPSFKESFIGKTYQKSLVFSIDRNKQTGKMKLNKDLEMDTVTIKRAIREYLTACGWKKAKLFG